MKVRAVRVRAADLQAGDLFSLAGPDYWARYNPHSLGEKVYIRTAVPCPADEVDEVVYKITVERHP